MENNLNDDVGSDFMRAREPLVKPIWYILLYITVLGLYNA